MDLISTLDSTSRQDDFVENQYSLPAVRHICSSLSSNAKPKAAKEPASPPRLVMRQGFTETTFWHRDSFLAPRQFKINPTHNKRVISKKLVTIFALHQDSFIVNQNLSSVYQLRKTGSGQILQPRQLNLSPGLAKIAPWWLACRDSLPAKVPGLESAGCATNAFCSYPLAVVRNAPHRA
jgi:hypothetical protein